MQLLVVAERLAALTALGTAIPHMEMPKSVQQLVASSLSKAHAVLDSYRSRCSTDIAANAHGSGSRAEWKAMVEEAREAGVVGMSLWCAVRSE